ncbi:hypothetical protein [Marichromatium gracile]|uniref:Uncharacterized protein n=1 Tax=Marichromatium gracile TaxID=1048 RepID=A0ABR5VEV6_MARGR|nr:hypothetical protein [Marichromatium gracile]KXX64258.1 hypothetical protein AY586_14215 [Marichromatium gracile]
MRIPDPRDTFLDPRRQPLEQAPERQPRLQTWSELETVHPHGTDREHPHARQIEAAILRTLR